VKCSLCHLPFQNGNVIYDMKNDDGGKNHFHMSCFYETRQGRMGYAPSAEYVFGQQLELF
jgi:hypothetical protein